MAKVWCCRRFQEAQVFKIAPTKSNVLEEFVLYNSRCTCCNQPVVQILRADSENSALTPVRLSPRNIPAFLMTMQVLWKPSKFSPARGKISKFVLGYNEFGRVGKCFSNLFTLNIGRVETDLVLDLKYYKKHFDAAKAIL